jgi:DNA-binding winged helix-turn-helix (wHTH) protein/tetratricopeptide (TPR) repeat protein
MSNTGKELYEFGPFRLDSSKRVLLRDNHAVPLQLKAFETLLVLVRHSEQVVLKDDLMKAVWPDTFVEESNLAQNIFVLRKTLGDTVGDHRYIVTIPGRGYSFAGKVRAIPQEESLLVASHSRTRVVIDEEISPDVSQAAIAGKTTTTATTSGTRQRLVLAAAILFLMVAATSYFYLRRAPKLTDKDTVVLADFANSTGDPVFNGTLRQGLSAQLEQSPFLNLLSDRRIAQTLSLMAQPKDAPLNHELAREVCQRTASAAVLDGSIAQIGTQYLLTLKALNCSTGELLASTQAQATDKNHVLDALGKVAAEIRPKLGESLVSVEKYDTPPQEVTTPSLEALQAYTLAYREFIAKNDGFAAIPLFQRAISLDPNFAMAYARLGTIYFNAQQSARATENLQKAYQLRERVSAWEKLYIAAHHADIVDGDLEAARKTYELWAQIYPRDLVPPGNLGVIYGFLGDYEKALDAHQAALKLGSGTATDLTNLVMLYIELNRLEDAKAAAREAVRHVDSPVVHGPLYTIDFLQQDTAGMQREAAWAMGKPGWEDALLYNQSDTAAYGGHFAQARDLLRRAVDSAQHADRQETAASYDAEAAVREALVGNLSSAKQQTRTALALANDTEVEAMSAIALALTDDSVQSALLADRLDKAFPKGTVVQFNLLPTIRAAAALRRDPRKALEALAASAPYELGQTNQVVSFSCYPIYLRGEAYLSAKQGVAAAAEFQKILDHPGVVQNEPIGALAHLGLGRAYALAGDKDKARTAFKDFLTLWKDADPDIPILKQAKAEYAKLQ